ncbi:nucleotidyltransferase domain-containing protein [Candidatus Sumerlaeota bacterium]|nr:nucleotidyltransferase domain-containing protein [Candidatus Sumerlaeota bacterium]
MYARYAGVVKVRYHDVEICEGEIEEFCQKWRIRELSLFGSLLREDFGPTSDVACLVVFEPDADWSLLDVIAADQELSILLGRSVDLVEKPVVQSSANWIRRRHILDSARTIYAR